MTFPYVEIDLTSFYSSHLYDSRTQFNYTDKNLRKKQTHVIGKNAQQSTLYYNLNHYENKQICKNNMHNGISNNHTNNMIGVFDSNLY